MQRNNGLGLGLLVCCIGIQANASVVYEGFDYTPGTNIVGQAGGEGWGGSWSGTDTDDRGTPFVGTGLSFGAIEGAGGSYARPSRYGVAQSSRQISSASQAALTADNTTIWFSVLMDPTSAPAAGLGFANNSNGAIVFGDTALVDSVNPGTIPPTIGANGSAVGVSFDGNGGAFADMAVQGVIYNDGARTAGTADQVVIGDNTVMVVGKIEWAANGTDDVLSLYLVSDPESALPAAFTTMEVDLDQSSFNLVATCQGQTEAFDEIRFGTSLEEVGVVPILGVMSVDFAGDAETGFQGTGYNQTIMPNYTAKAVTNSFATDTTMAPGMIDVAVEASSWLNVLEDRGSLTDGTPEGFTYKELYEDYLYASGATDYLTLTLSGLNPNQEYELTVYAWAPNSSDGTDKEWSIIQGTPAPQTQSINHTDELVNNSSFAMDFTVTSTAGGVIQVQNTAGFSQACINGFRLTTDAGGAGGEISIVSITPIDSEILRIECDLSGNTASGVAPVTKGSLTDGSWAYVPHSDDGINEFVTTNLDYSSVSGTNFVIYVESTNAAGFFGLE